MADDIDPEFRKILLKKQACFSQLTENETKDLAELLAVKEYAAGDTIVTQGDHVDSVYIIVKGEADVRLVSIINNMPQYQSLAILKPYEAIGLNETGFYSLSGIRTATVVAKTDITLLRLSVAAFHGFALAYPHVNEVMRKHASMMKLT